MADVSVAVIYYSATGSVHALARAAAEAAEKAGAEVRLRKVHELAPREAVESNEGWSKHALETQDVPEATLDDLEWADAVLLGSPTRYGLPTAQLKQFLDRPARSGAPASSSTRWPRRFTSAGTAHGGQESTILAINNTFYHWGAIIVPPGYADPVQFQAGNPYGTSHVSANGANPPGEIELARHRASRPAAPPRSPARSRSASPPPSPPARPTAGPSQEGPAVVREPGRAGLRTHSRRRTVRPPSREVAVPALPPPPAPRRGGPPAARAPPPAAGLEDEQAVAAAYNAHGAELYRFVLRGLRDPGAAQDVVQETFLRAWRAADRYDPDLASLRVWLFAIARNALLDHVRARGARPWQGMLVDDEQVERVAPAVEDGTERLLRGWVVEEALHRLTPEHRAVLVETYLKDRPYAEVAAELGAAGRDGPQQGLLRAQGAAPGDGRDGGGAVSRRTTTGPPRAGPS